MKDKTMANTARKKTLSRRLLILMIAAIIPLNVFIIALISRMMYVSGQEIRNSHLRELESICSRIDSDIEVLSFRIDGLERRLKVDMLELEQEYPDTITLYSIWSELKDIWQGTEFFDSAYLKLGKQPIILTYNSTKMTNLQSEELKSVLEKYKLPGRNYRRFGHYDDNEQELFIYTVNKNNYSFGFVIRPEIVREKMLPLVHDEGYYEIIYEGSGSEEQLVFASARDHEANRNKNYIELTADFSNGYQIRLYVPSQTLYQNISLIQILLIVIAIVTVFSVPLAWQNIRKTVIKPLRQLENGMIEIKRDNIKHRLPDDAETKEFVFVNQTFNEMADEIGNLRIEAYEKEIERLNVEALNLRLQINPHMLLNSFNMIYNLAESKEFQKIQDYSFHLMNFFRYALRRSENSVTLENELKFVRDYLEVQKIRYPGMLHSNYYVEPGLEKIVVPPFIIQSFVENSVIHGMVIGHEMESYVEIVKEDDHVIISISDNGAGISEERLEKILQEEPITDKTGTHIGIWNSIRRLRLYYGADTRFSIDSRSGEGTRVTIRLPIEMEETKNDIVDS